MASALVTGKVLAECSVCLKNIMAQPRCKEEELRKLKCDHIFHKECVEEWLEIKPTCPLCRAPVDESAISLLGGDEFRIALEQAMLAVRGRGTEAGSNKLEISDKQTLLAVRETINTIREVRILDLNEDTQQAATARKVHSVAARIFGFSNQ